VGIICLPLVQYDFENKQQDSPIYMKEDMIWNIETGSKRKKWNGQSRVERGTARLYMYT
jgi:hypothetical protein